MILFSVKYTFCKGTNNLKKNDAKWQKTMQLYFQIVYYLRFLFFFLLSTRISFTRLQNVPCCSQMTGNGLRFGECVWGGIAQGFNRIIPV